MLKGKTIQSSAPTSLKPKLIKNECSGVETILKQIAEPSIKTLYYMKTINQTDSDESQNKVQQNVNIRYSLEYLKQKFPGYSTLYYTEIFDLLQSTDYNLTVTNLNSNIQKFINLGNNIQSQISRLTNLNMLSKNSFSDIKAEAQRTIGFFAMEDSVNSAFIDFNSSVSVYYRTLQEELNFLKSKDFKKYDLLNLYLDFFLYIHEDLKSKFLDYIDYPDINFDIIQSRVLSLNNSKTVLQQFKTLLEIEIQGKEIEYNNVKNYLDTLLPSLHILRKQNFKEFKEQFKSLIRA